MVWICRARGPAAADRAAHEPGDRGAPVRDRLLAEGFELEKMSPDALTAFIRDGLARWGPLARRLMATDAGK